MKVQKKHGKEKLVHGKEIKSERQIDGQEKPVEEGHTSLENIDKQLIEKMTDEIKDRGNVEEAFTDEEIKEMIGKRVQEKLQENSKKDFNFDKTKEEIYNEIEEDASHVHEMPQ